MKIIQIIPSLSSGGAERITVDICNKLSENNEVYLIQLYGDRNKKFTFYKNQVSENVHYINLNGQEGKLFDLMILPKFLKLISTIKPNIIHTHLCIIYSFIPSIFMKSIKYFHTIHNTANTECLTIKGISFRKLIRFYFLKRLITPVTISLDSRNSYNDFYKLDNSVLIENGCFKKEKTKCFRQVEDEISKYKTSMEDIVFLNIARFSPVKNHKMLISVFNRLIDEKQKVKLLIIGDGFFSSEGKIFQKKARNGIFFLGTRDNISDYLFSCDAFCLSSMREGLPISLLEAISAGCIPICTPAGGIPNVILNESLGFLSKDFSQESYYQNVLEFLKNRSRVNTQNLINFFINNFSIDRTTKRLIEVYKK